MDFPRSILTRWQRLDRSLTRYSYAYRFLHWAYRFWQETFTRPGKFVLASALALGISSSLPEEMAGALALSAFAALFILAGAISLTRRLQAEVRRHMGERCVAGSTISLRITVRNTSRRDLCDVGAYEFRLPDHLRLTGDIHYIPVLKAGQEQVFEYQLSAARRGSYSLPGPTLVSTFPFGLTQAKRFYPDAQRLLVYPDFHRLRHLAIPVGKRYQPGGIVLTSHVGESMEFIGNREYRPGDRQRDLHPRSWARVGYPVVKQYQEEFLTRIAILVDTYVPFAAVRKVRPTNGSGEDPLDANLSLAAAIADYLARQEYIVDLFAAGPKLYHFQAGRSLAYLDNILDILACIERCPSDPLEVIVPQFSEEVSRISTVIALLLDWEPRRQTFIQGLLDAGVEVKPIIVSAVSPGVELAGVGVGARWVTPRQIREGLESL